MRWIGNAQGNFGWRSHAARVGLLILAFLISSWGLGFAAMAAGELLGFGKEQGRQFMEQVRIWHMEQTGKPYPVSKADQEHFFTTGRKWGAAFSLLLAIFGVTIGLGLWRAENWARLILLFAFIAWVIIWAWVFVSHAPSSSSRVMGTANLVGNFLLTQWKTLAVILFLLWSPTRALCQREA